MPDIGSLPTTNFCGRTADTLRRLTQPEIFQGAHAKPPYFEGWYYRVQTPDGRAYAFIPGLSLGLQNSVCFLQTAGPDQGDNDYLSYPVSAFQPSRGGELHVGPNLFFKNGFSVDTGRMRAHVAFRGAVPYRSKGGFGIMGPFGLLPFLECNHCVVIARTGLGGYIENDRGLIRLDGGCGYVEKDWGSAFPRQYFWIEACDLENGGSFMLSAAQVPLGRTVINGLIGFLRADGRLIRFATYTGAKVGGLSMRDGTLRLCVDAPGLALSVCVTPGPETTLRAPSAGGMIRSVGERIRCPLVIESKIRGRAAPYRAVSRCAACEIVGDPHFMTETPIL